MVRSWYGLVKPYTGIAPSRSASQRPAHLARCVTSLTVRHHPSLNDARSQRVTPRIRRPRRCARTRASEPRSFHHLRRRQPRLARAPSCPPPPTTPGGDGPGTRPSPDPHTLTLEGVRKGLARWACGKERQTEPSWTQARGKEGKRTHRGRQGGRYVRSGPPPRGRGRGGVPGRAALRVASLRCGSGGVLRTRVTPPHPADCCRGRTRLTPWSPSCAWNDHRSLRMACSGGHGEPATSSRMAWRAMSRAAMMVRRLR
jgi:hypothetical protein